MRLLITTFLAGLIVQAISFPVVCSAQEDTAAPEIRLANGTLVEGTFKAATPDGLKIETAKGVKTLPWKYLSTGTRFRYEREIPAASADKPPAASTNQPAAVR